MVYRGKPSKSCRQCRTRDIKCDKQKESCGQCIRAHLVCPGYFDRSKFILYNETESVVRKALLRPPIPVIPPPPEKILAPCIEDRANDVFASRFVFCTTARFPYMDHFWLAQPPHPHLAASIRAAALANLSFHLESPEILQCARRQYSSALRLTNNALKNPQTANHNSTLLTVLLLDLYEKLTKLVVNDPWYTSNHLDAAVALLQLSSPSQFHDTIRLQLFRQVGMSILLRCLRLGDDIPPGWLLLRQSIDITDQDGQLESLMLEFVALQLSLRKKELQECEMHNRVEELDTVLLGMCSKPPKWKFADAIAGRVTVVELFVVLLESVTVNV